MNVRIVGYIFVLTVLSTADIVAMQVRQFPKDRDELGMLQAFAILRKVFRHRKLFPALQFLTSQQTSCGRRKILTAIQFFIVLQTSNGRRKLLRGRQILTIAVVVAIRVINQFVFEGMRIGEAANPGSRLRRRGPRSLEARSARRSRGEPATEFQESLIESCEHGLKMLHVNVRGYFSHIAETTALLRGTKEQPFRVTLNETFLSKAIEHVELEGYQLLARRDREGQWGGGVLVFVLDEYAPRVTLVEKSQVAERILAMVHSDRGPYLECCWYRPPSPGNVESIKSFEAEYFKLRDGAVGFFALGDLNVHSVRWLQHSAMESVEGRLLHDISDQLGLRQLVTEPTRGKYLLDLVFTDLPDCTAEPCTAVADHK